jgi:hypothetical protein
MDEKFSSSTVKSVGRNEMFETFWKSDGSAVWMYTEIPEDKGISYLFVFTFFWEKKYIPVWHWVISCFINVDFPLPDSAKKYNFFLQF